MEVKPQVVDRVLHWLTVLMLLLMLNLSTELHYTNWEIKGPLLHRQDAVEFHATTGLIILVLSLTRLLYTRVKGDQLVRSPTKSLVHARVVKAVHIAMYVALFVLISTGLGLINNYEIPLSVLGVELVPVKQDFLDVFPTLREVHVFAQSAFWYLVILHFAGYIYSKR